MKKLNFVISLFMAAVLVFGQVGLLKASAATPPVTGTIQSIVVKDADTANSYVEVALKLENGTTQTFKLSIKYALKLGLIKKENGAYVPNQAMLDLNNPATATIDPAKALPEDPNSDTGFKHPIGLILEAFFGETLGVDYKAIMDYHEEGVGFGVLVQAMWMTVNLEGDADLLDQIIRAKQSGDYSGIVLPDGSTPKNWGQLRKAALNKGNNLGAAKDKDAKTTGKPEDKGNGKPEDKDKDKQKDKDKGKGKP